MWCPSCRDEFRAGYTRCPDCDTDLVAARPPAPARVRETSHRPLPPPDDVLVEFDLGDWPDAERAGLELRLRMAEVPFEWDEGLLVVNEAFRDDVGDLIDFVDDVEDDDAPPPPDPDLGGTRRRDLASPGVRALGYVIDWIVLRIMVVAITRLLGLSWGAETITALAIGTGYEIGLVARYGRTIGALTVRVRVRRVDGREPPGVRVAAVRWLVPAIGALALPFGVVGALLLLAWTLAVYLPIFGVRRQGLHDRAAHTVVTNEASRA